MTHKSVFTWLSLDMAIFIIANALLLAIASLFDRLSNLSTLGYFDLIVFGLAIYRAAQIISNEPVTKPLRAPFVDEVHKDGKIVEQPKKSGFEGAMGLLIYCPSCTGVWLAAAFAYAYVFFPAATFLVAFFLALSALERILSVSLGRIKEK